MAPRPGILVWEIPRTEEPDGLQSMGLLRVRHDWTYLHATRFVKCRIQVRTLREPFEKIMIDCKLLKDNDWGLFIFAFCIIPSTAYLVPSKHWMYERMNENNHLKSLGELHGSLMKKKNLIKSLMKISWSSSGNKAQLANRRFCFRAPREQEEGRK